MTPVQLILSKFTDTKQSGDRWQACCPAHDDTRASLTISGGDDGRALIYCHAGCRVEDVCSAIGLKLSDLMPPREPSNGKPRIGATYDYRDEHGDLLFQVVRFEPKDFRQRQPKDGGGWLWTVKGVRVIPFLLDKLAKADLSQPVFVAEGERDVLRLQEHGLLATCNAGGAGKWKSQHAEFLAGRPAIVLADNDTSGVHHAWQAAESLLGVAESVKRLELPGLADKGDVSDWFDSGGTAEKLQELVDAAPNYETSPEPPKPTNKKGGKRKAAAFVPAMEAAIIGKQKLNHFAQDAGQKLYRYRDGVYHSRGEEFVRRAVKKHCERLKMVDEWSPASANAVAEFIRVDSPQLHEQPPLDVLNVKNGILRIADRELLPHSPDMLTCAQLPVEYDPDATCPAIDQFVSEVFPPDAVPLAYELVSWLMLPITSIQQAVLLYGAGGNGKSDFLSMISAFLGRRNISTLSLHKLESDRFAAARLLGKLANICPDLPTEHLTGTSVFKSITGGDSITAEHKFKDSFDFVPFARLLFSANSLPRSEDSSDGFFSRWCVVPFDA